MVKYIVFYIELSKSITNKSVFEDTKTMVNTRYQGVVKVGDKRFATVMMNAGNGIEEEDNKAKKFMDKYENNISLLPPVSLSEKTLKKLYSIPT